MRVRWWETAEQDPLPRDTPGRHVGLFPADATSTSRAVVTFVAAPPEACDRLVQGELVAVRGRPVPGGAVVVQGSAAQVYSSYPCEYSVFRRMPRFEPRSRRPSWSYRLTPVTTLIGLAIIALLGVAELIRGRSLGDALAAALCMIPVTVRLIATSWSKDKRARVERSGSATAAPPLSNLQVTLAVATVVGAVAACLCIAIAGRGSPITEGLWLLVIACGCAYGLLRQRASRRAARLIEDG